ncbi:MAG: hypothetical protein WDW38_006523 [Sanguina aurantia]
MDKWDFFVGDGDGSRDEDDSGRVTNGRIRLNDGGRSGNGGGSTAPYQLFSTQGTLSSRGHDGDLRRYLPTQEDGQSLVGRNFFSAANREALQQALRHGVYRASGQDKMVVGRQSDLELGIIMRSAFLKLTRNTDDGAAQQLRAMNDYVLDFSIPVVLQEARMYLTYRRDISTLPIPLERGQIMSQKGSRQMGGLESRISGV